MEAPFGDGAVAGGIPTVGQWQIVAMSSSTPPRELHEPPAEEFAGGEDQVRHAFEGAGGGVLDGASTRTCSCSLAQRLRLGRCQFRRRTSASNRRTYWRTASNSLQI